MKLAGLLSTLRAAESIAAEAKAARDDALASAAEARARREREASDAAETLAGIEREIEAERNALEAIETESGRRRRDAGAADGDAYAFDAAVAEAEALAASRSADAQAREARARELEAEADALEKAAEERKRERERIAAEPAESPPAPASAAARRAETDRLRDALASAESELSALETRLLSEASRPMTHTGHVLASNTADAAELERRLRDVTERLEAKRAETATLAGERRELERVVAEALMERRRKERDFRSTRFENDEMDDDDVDAERLTDAPSTEKESARAKKGGLTRRAREKKKPTAGIGVGVFVASAARRVDALGVRAGRRLRRSGGWRSAALLYALGLHVFAFLVLALRALGGSPELKPVEGVDQRRGRA
jgi:chromosome segregation ATPase